MRKENNKRLGIWLAGALGDIATTLVGTANPANIEKNVRWIEEPIDQTLLDEVLKILEPIHNKTWPGGRPENN